jgi:hypothetical protein
MSILDNLLKKFKIDDYAGLDAEERATFDLWAKELEGKPVTIQELTKFLETQQLMNMGEFENFDNPKAKDFYIKVYSRICRQIISFINAPQKARVAREASIKNTLK